MNFRTSLNVMLAGFVVFCGWLIIESGFFKAGQASNSAPCILLQQTAANNETPQRNEPAPQENSSIQADYLPTFSADNTSASTLTIGSEDPDSGFKFQLNLTSKGAAIAQATLSEFDDRDYQDPQPFKILSPMPLASGELLPMANAGFVLVREKMRLPLGKLHWVSYPVEETYESQTARFEAIIKADGKDALKITKTYTVTENSFHLQVSESIENISATEHKVSFDLTGPLGLPREGIRMDMRKAVAGFREANGQASSVRLDMKKLRKAVTAQERKLTKPGSNLLWVAATDKYFAAILVPQPDTGKEFCDYVSDKSGRLYNPDRDPKQDSGDEAVGVDIKIAPAILAPAGQVGSSKTYNFQLYLGPKDKSLFDNNEFYSKLGFVQAIDFMSCCCPSSIIYPLAFGILALMKWMYFFIPNYGIVIIILVFMVRLALHPLTKKGQVSMSKMSSLAPKAEEIKKKYANNKAELNKNLMALYREQGASPVTGMLPMMVQMPIWMALYSAIYTSIALRGAAFLPVWITDLSAPDALVRFATVTVPLVGWKINSFNLLPIMMGVAFYLQQKLMPKNAAAASNPQVEQQQKMMMIMLPLLFPLMLYKAPSGLNLYIMASTFAGVIEQYIIRKHIREKEQAESTGLVAVTSKTGGKVKKKKPKPFHKQF